MILTSPTQRTVHLVVAPCADEPPVWHETVAATVAALVRAVAAQDEPTGAHLQRVGTYALLLGRRLGLRGAALDALHYGALLHDVGKLGVRAALLHSPLPLSASEQAQLRQHPIIGAQIVAPLAIAATVAPTIRSHHERWDGGGYPDGLAGEAIPFAARIVAVLDAFDGMTAPQPRSAPLAQQEALQCLHAGAGSRWDPAIVAAWVECLAPRERPRERAVGGSLGGWG